MSEWEVVSEEPLDDEWAVVSEAPIAKKKLSLSFPGPIGMALDAGITGGISTVGKAISGYGGMLQALGPGGAEAGANAQEGIQNALSVAPLSRQGQALASLHGYLPQKFSQFTDWAGDTTAEKSNSPGLGATVKTGLEAIPLALGAKVSRGVTNPRGVVGGPKGAPAPAQVPPRPAGLASVPPTIDELAAQSTAAYARAKKAGADIKPESFEGLKTRISAMAKEEGINAKLHPDSAAVLDDIAATEGAVSLQQLETLRKIASDARGSVKPADSRIAGRMVDEIDDYMDAVGPKDLVSGTPEGFAALKEARNLYSRKMKAEEIGELVRRAELSAPNFGASGMENALRTEFRALSKNTKKMRRFTAEERAAIEKVAKGGPMENILRQVGKFAPMGVVSTAGSIGAGLMFGGPAGAVAFPAIGAASRYAATRMTKNNVRLAEETMRRGPKRKSAIEAAEEAEVKRLLENISQ